MRNELDNKEDQTKQVDEPTNNFDNKENLEEYKKIQDKITQQKDEQKEEAKYLTGLLGNDNIGEILSKYLKLDSDTIAFIENPNKPKDISKNLQFLNNQNYINKTNEEYLELFKNTQDEFKRANILKIIRKITKAVNKKNLKQIISIKKDFDNMNIKDFKKMTNILKKYEKGEFIDLPNGLSYELCTKKGEKKNKKNIPNEIRLGDDEYFIKTHVTKKDADYKQYVNSLLEIRKLFQNKGINLKYVKRSTWLVNKEFIKAYEQEFLIPKYGNKYKKIQSIKVLEDTAPAEIFYKVDKTSNPYDEKNEKKNPLRFIKEKKGLLGYVTQDDEHLKSFNEAEMWLDIDKLTHEKQEESNLSDNENENDNNNDTETHSKEKLSNEEQIEQEYAEVLVKLIGNNEKFKELLEGKHKLSIKDIENIYNELHNVRSNSKKESLKNGKTTKQDFDNLEKFCFDPKAIEKYKTFNCSGGSLMMASIINKLGGQATIVNVYHHVVCLAQIGNKQYIIDTINREWEDVTGKLDITNTEYKNINKFTIKKPLLGMYTEGYIYDSIAQGERYVHGSNYEQMKTEKEYEKAYKEFKDLLGEKLDTYPKTGDEDFPKCILKKNFPEFDKKIYEIEHNKLPKAGFFGRIRLKTQRFFLKLKQFFKKK